MGEAEDQELRTFSGTQGAELIQDQKETQFRIEIENRRPRSGLQRCFVWPAEYFKSFGVLGNILKLEIRHKSPVSSLLFGTWEGLAIRACIPA